MRYGVIGPRDFKGHTYENADYVENVLGSFLDMSSLVSGGSRGIETMAEDWAAQVGVPFEKIPPNIRLHGQVRAFDIRNGEIIGAADCLIVFWDGCTQNIIDTLSRAMLLAKRVNLIPMI